MSLLKTKTLTNGFTGEYWKIVQLNIDRINKGSHVVIGLFKDASFKNAPNAIMEQISYDWYGDEFPFTAAALAEKDAVEIAYEKIVGDAVAANEVTQDEDGNDVQPAPEKIFFANAETV